MKQAAIAALLLVLAPLQVQALETSELLGLVAMPLAVAAVSNATGVSADDLSHLVATLNRAEVQPTQFVQVVRYAPVALTIEREQPFIAYVDEQVTQGATGSQLVTRIEQQYRSYDLQPQFVTLDDATTFVASDEYITRSLIETRVTEVRQTSQPVIGDTNDLLALIAMPLAVSLVSEITGVPMNDLSTLVATLNNAQVAPLQIVEVLRYAPVALVVQNDQPFVPFIQAQVNDGFTGTRLVQVIDQRLRTYDVTPQLTVSSPRLLVVDETFIPPVVVTRVAQARAGHPHGGPPGQLKKAAGVQTGAEIVHGRKPGRDQRLANRKSVEQAPVVRVKKPKKVKETRVVVQTQPPPVVVAPSPDPGRGGPKVDSGRGKQDGGHKGNKDKDHGGGKSKGKGKG